MCLTPRAPLPRGSSLDSIFSLEPNLIFIPLLVKIYSYQQVPEQKPYHFEISLMQIELNGGNTT
jgi:uncharacterized membrane protein